MQLSYDYAKDRALMCLRANYESHLRILVAEGVSDSLQHSLFLLDEWCFTRHAPIP